MQDEEFHQKQEDQQKSSESSGFDKTNNDINEQSLSNTENQTNKIKSLEQKVESLQQQLNSSKSVAIQVDNLKEQLTSVKEEKVEIEAKLESSNREIEEKNRLIKEINIEKDTYLSQIAKLQNLINQTEKEIEVIEAGHIEIQDQLRFEIKRLEERTGQMSEDLTLETSGTLARDRHIRVVLNESEIGRVLLYIVDYFDNPKKKVLGLDTLSSELNIPPIIARRNLRHLHELGVCKFNEVSREIKIIK